MAPPVQHYIFGYGSLICRHSRSHTAAPAVATPVRVHGLQRVWSVRAPGFSAMGVVHQLNNASNTNNTNTTIIDDGDDNQPKCCSSTTCLGVLVPVQSDEDLARLDERELGYQREPIGLEKVHLVEFLEDHHYSDPGHAPILEAKRRQQHQQQSLNEGVGEEPNIKIWVYVPELHELPDQASPIVQSYVDTILRGCLDYSEEFAVSFLETTQGWMAQHYVDDRHKPIYPRGDPEWSKQHANRLDALLQQYRPAHFQHRRRIE